MSGGETSKRKGITTMKWTAIVTYQYKYFNRKPSTSNTRTTEADFVGLSYTREKIIAELEARRMDTHMRVVSYTEPMLIVSAPAVR